MKILIIIPLLFCLQDTTRVDTLKPIRLFFEQKTCEQRAEDINFKLDLLIAKLQEKQDSINLK